MISVRYSLRDKNSKWKSAIRTSVTYNGNRILFCPGYSISPENWDSNKGLPRPVKGNVAVKTTTTNLKELDLKITRLYDDLSLNGSQVVPAEIFKQKILGLVHPEKYTGENITQVTIVDYINVFIKDCETGKRIKKDRTKMDENTIKTYRTTGYHFSNFQVKLNRVFSINDFSQQLHDEFLDYLEIDLELSKNSASKNIGNLRQVILYAVKQKILPGSIMIDIKFETAREDSDNIFLSEKEIELMINFKDFNSKTEEEVRDIFVLGCYTGLRFSNYSQFNLDFIVDDVYSAVQVKTESKVLIPIHPCVRDIINKYNSKLPQCPTNQEFNRTLKEIGQRIAELNVPFVKQITRGREKVTEVKMKWEMIHSHTARRSFCTNMYLMGVPVPSIMSASGHQTEKNFRKYMKGSGLDHAMIMKKIWENKTVFQTESDNKNVFESA